ncbi:hypothetical protein MGK_00099 [Candida albicans P57055]|nr:hypothetical protein MGK_00099 [Candida albicans P57055]
MKPDILTVSLCHKYIARLKHEENNLEILNLQTPTVCRSYNLQTLVRQFSQSNYTGPCVVSQLQWEHILPDSVSTKLAVVVDNLHIAMIIDFRKEDTEPIFIKQPKNEGIESIEWIPPPSFEKDLGAYTNSRQLLIFSKHDLAVRVFSLDCTHVLFTIYKPISSLLIRPSHDNRFWSILANTLEYNKPPVLYHFYNEGSVSLLIKSIKLPNTLTTEPKLSWSDKGTWLQIFNDHETIFGYNLLVYDLLGRVSERRRIDPLVDVDILDNGYNMGSDDHLHFSSNEFQSSWVTLSSDREYIVVSDLQGHQLQIQIIEIRLLRVIKAIELDLKDKQGWKQSWDKFVYGKIALPENLEITKVYSHEFELYICINNTYVVGCDLELTDSDDIEIEIESIVEVDTVIVDFYKNDNKLVLVSEKQIVTLNDDNDKPQKIFETNGTIKNTQPNADQITIIYNTTQKTLWETVFTSNKFASPRKKRHLVGNTSISLDDITDTFNLKKRIKSK